MPEARSEYHVEVISGAPEKQTERLNELASDGWELITSRGEYLYFRRMIENGSKVPIGFEGMSERQSSLDESLAAGFAPFVRSTARGWL